MRAEGTGLTAGMSAALMRFRVIAIVVGVGLVILVLVGMPLKYLYDNATVVAIVGPAHGALYVLYLIAGFELSQRARWSWRGTIAVLLAGTIPFLSFVAERVVTRKIRAREPL